MDNSKWTRCTPPLSHTCLSGEADYNDRAVRASVLHSAKESSQTAPTHHKFVAIHHHAHRILLRRLQPELGCLSLPRSLDCHHSRLTLLNRCRDIQLDPERRTTNCPPGPT